MEQSTGNNLQDPSGCTKPAGLPLLNKELLESCIHCGLCLPACPTYLVSGLEAESPRGRIYLLDMLRTGQIESTDPALEHIDTCLGCMGCQTACPSGVKYEKILSQARPLLAGERGSRSHSVLRLAFAKILPNYALLKFLGAVFLLAQKAGLTKIRPVVPFAPKLSDRLADWQKFLPQLSPRSDLPRNSPARIAPVAAAPNPVSKDVSDPSPAAYSEVQLFSGCVMDILYNDVNHAAIRLLNRQGRAVAVPQQTCCGALAAHAGQTDIACDLARKNIEYFEKTSGDIAVTSAGCGAMLKEYGELLEYDPAWHDRAQTFSSRIKDVTEVLAANKFDSAPRLQGKIAYHAACHLTHVQKVRQAPLTLLSMIEGAELVPLEEQEHCCGSAGIYNLLHTETSLAVLDRKMKFIEQTGVGCIATGNPGCLLQLQAGAAMRGLPLRVVHPIVLLDEAFSKT
jgi:glycolate oxidase iron-sulfur subunit